MSIKEVKFSFSSFTSSEGIMRLASIGRGKLSSFPFTFRVFTAAIAVMMPSDPSYIPASMTVS